jgi:hypothetical protein
VRLDHLQDEPGGNGSVERITALLERCHPTLSGEPVR